MQNHRDGLYIKFKRTATNEEPKAHGIRALLR